MLSEAGTAFILSMCMSCVLNTRSIVILQVRVGNVYGYWEGVVCGCILTVVWLQRKIHVREWCCKVVGSCKVEQVATCGFLLPRNLITRCSAIAERPRATCCVSFGQKWKTGTGRQYFTDIIGLSSTTVT